MTRPSPTDLRRLAEEAEKIADYITSTTVTTTLDGGLVMAPDIVVKTEWAASLNTYARNLRAAADEIEALDKALEPFARVWRINEELTPFLERSFREFCPGVWPTMGDAKRASDLLGRHQSRQEKPNGH